MKAIHYIKKVKDSQAYKDFITEDPKAYLCSLFFIRDFTENHNETQVDFYSPKKKAIVSFKVGVGRGVERVPLNKKAVIITHKKFVPKPLSEDIKMDVDELKPTLTDEMRNREMTYEIDKLLTFLNVSDDRVIWNCTAFLKGLGLLQAHVEDETNSVLFMEKKSLFDLIKFTSAPEIKMPGLGSKQENPVEQPKIKILSMDEIKNLERQIVKAEKGKKSEKTEKESKKKNPNS